jgi:hypothetical protein
MKLLNDLIVFIIMITRKYNIDESHDISHSMDVLHHVNNIYETQMYVYPPLKNHKRTIFIAALLHDMCDNKYMDEEKGIQEICDYLKPRIKEDEVNLIKKIIMTMSYSKIKKEGFPKFDEIDHYWAYHVVREADLLSAYNFDRCMIFHIKKQKGDLESAFHIAENLFQNRVLKHNEDKLLLTEYSKTNYLELHNNAIQRINAWKKILKNPI